MTRFRITFVAMFVFSTWTIANAQIVEIERGQTSVLLDTATLETAANLVISSVGGGTGAPGELGAASVFFPINPRDAAAPALPTTFAYDPADFANTFSGEIEHSGKVSFNADSITVGDFTIGFDAGRAIAPASGFFVESNTGIAGILFDVADPPTANPTPAGIVIEGDLLVSSDFAQILIDSQLTSANLTGADVGDFFVRAIVPEPSAGLLLLASLGMIAAVRSRR